MQSKWHAFVENKNLHGYNYNVLSNFANTIST